MKNLMKMMTILFVVASLGFAGDMTKNLVVGFDASVLVGKVNYEGGGIKSVLGISPGLGIGYKSYFSPLKANNLSVYWDIGTDVLILPFIGLGADYKFNLENAKLYAGLNISSRLVALMIPLPSFAVGIYF